MITSIKYIIGAILITLFGLAWMVVDAIGEALFGTPEGGCKACSRTLPRTGDLCADCASSAL